ncbi:MAG: ferredoxin [Rubrivivax sp.]|nr:ferredoxin [Rubrivivax sp.]
MDPHAKHTDLLVFHLTGKRRGGALQPIDGRDLRPALLAPLRDLDALRHDFPLVLVDRRRGADCVHTLSGLVDGVLRDVAPRGIDGERLRRHGLQLEREIRAAVAAGAEGSLTDLWDAAAARLGEREGETLEQVLRHAGGALRADGAVLGCTPATPARLVRHTWQTVQREKARQFHADVGMLVQQLSDILRAAFSHSQAGRRPQSLQAALGGPHQDLFDFDALSRVVGKSSPDDELPASRRERLVRTLGVLESQRFFAPPEQQATLWTGGTRSETFGFEFDNCAAAALAFRERLPEAAELVRALAVAELESRGGYIEAEHDLFFEAFDENSLGADDLARLPDYLVCIPPERSDAPENASLIEMLSSGLPVKVLVQTADLRDEAALGSGHFAFGVRSARLATTAMGLGGVFVLQSPAANLYAVRAQIDCGLASRGPALFSVYAGATRRGDPWPPYLSTAAALPSRAFPAFSYDALGGSNWAERFSLLNCPQPEADWPLETLEFVDAAQQRVRAPCAFTFADFALCDPRNSAHFALAPREQWDDAMLPAADWLALSEQDAARRVPYVWAVDASDALHRVVVDAGLMQSARRCLLLWHRLQEHAGIHDSHAERLLAREKAAWAAAAPPAAAPEPAPQPAAAEAAAEAPAHSRDEAWIETARCPSCDECQHINPRMFAYDERKQAYIKDITAGTYRQLVEAAESCQVAIIHPGKPRDPDEPGLEDLLARAESFR